MFDDTPPNSAKPRLESTPFDWSTLPTKKSGLGLYKNILPNTQFLYFDDVNEIVSRLNRISSQQVGNNPALENEKISITS